MPPSVQQMIDLAREGRREAQRAMRVALAEYRRHARVASDCTAVLDALGVVDAPAPAVTDVDTDDLPAFERRLQRVD